MLHSSGARLISIPRTFSDKMRQKIEIVLKRIFFELNLVFPDGVCQFRHLDQIDANHYSGTDRFELVRNYRNYISTISIENQRINIWAQQIIFSKWSRSFKRYIAQQQVRTLCSL